MQELLEQFENIKAKGFRAVKDDLLALSNIQSQLKDIGNEKKSELIYLKLELEKNKSEKGLIRKQNGFKEDGSDETIKCTGEMINDLKKKIFYDDNLVCELKKWEIEIIFGKVEDVLIHYHLIKALLFNN